MGKVMSQKIVPENENGGNLFCTCGGDVSPVQELSCNKCKADLIRKAFPAAKCTCCPITIGQIWYFYCPTCDEKCHCGDAWGCKKSECSDDNNLCPAKYSCAQCGAESKEQVPFF